MDGPWHIDIRPWQSWAARSGGWSVTQNSGLLGGGKTSCNNTVQAMIAWDVALTVGTWRITLVYEAWSGGNDRAVRVRLDSTVIGSINMGATDGLNVTVELAGVVVATDKVYRLEFANAVNQGYMQFQHLSLDRIA